MQIKNSYIICSLPRSGSTLLGAALAKTGLAGNPQEFFKEDTLAVWKGRFDLPRDAPLAECVSRVVAATRTANGVFGQKMMWYQLEDIISSLRLNSQPLENLSMPSLLAGVFPEVKLIFIRREDRLKQAISLFKSIQSNVWHNNRDFIVEEKALRFDYFEIKALMRNLEKQELNWKSFLNNGNFDFYEITYEELIAGYEKTLTEILDFLGLPCKNIPPLDELGFIPTRTEINSQWETQFLETNEKVREFDRSDFVKKLPQNGYRATMTTDQADWIVYKYQQFSVEVHVKNTSDCLWRSIGASNLQYWIRLKYYWLDEAEGVLKTHWANLPADCHPGQTAHFELMQIAPAKTGPYTIEFDLTQSGTEAFPRQGSQNLSIPVTVEVNEFQTGVANYFGEVESLSQHTIHSPWLGSLEIYKFPAVYHQSHGWLYCYDEGAATDSFWFKTISLGHLWTSREKYPLMWSDEKKAWLKYIPNSAPNPVYENTETGERLTGNRGKYDF